MQSLEHIPIGLNHSNRKEYTQAFDSGAISCRPNDPIRSESALVAVIVSIALLGLTGPASARTDTGMPKLDVAKSCREAQSIGGDDKNLAFKGCMQDEKDAQATLAQKWPHFKPEDRRNCLEQGAKPMPSYVEILTCLEMYDGSSTFNTPASGTRQFGGAPTPAAPPAPAVPPVAPDATAPSDAGGQKF